jgi:hypothetical protein
VKINRKNYLKAFIKIQNKEGELISFSLNTPQDRLRKKILELEKESRPVRIIILKARQMGFSTFTSGWYTTDTVTNIGRKTAVVAHTEESTKEIFGKYRVMVNNLPEELRPQTSASNAQEIVFDTKENTGIGGRIRCMTAGGEGIGRGSTIHNLHISEYAFWKGDKKQVLTGLLQAVPRLPNTSVIIESTANGMDHFKELWDLAVSGKSEFVPFFCAWHEMEEYRMPVPKDFKLDSTWDEKKVMEEYNLDMEQIVWRRWCILNNCHGDIEQFHQEYPACPEEAFISTGRCVFDKKIIIERINEIKDYKPEKQGYFIYNKYMQDSYTTTIDNIRWIDDEKGAIKIFREPIIQNKEGSNRSDGIPYVIGCDTAGDGSDYFAAHVIDNITGSQVAVYHMDKVDEDLFADQIYCLGKYYNDALVGIETNFSTLSTRKLTELQYPNLYVRETVDNITKQIQKKYGFVTSVKTRPLIINNLVEIARENITNINDITTLREMLTFIRNEKGKPEAEIGKHDDLVMSLAITYFISNQQVGFKKEETERRDDVFSSLFKLREDEEGGYIEW